MDSREPDRMGWHSTSSYRLAALALVLASSSAVGDEFARHLDSEEDVSALPGPAHAWTSQELFSRLEAANQSRTAHLKNYSVFRVYTLQDGKGKLHARMVVLVRYDAPDTITFQTLCEKGSGLVRTLVLKRLMASEREALADPSRKGSSLRPDNYEFHFLGEEETNSIRYLVVEAVPKHKSKYLFEGKIWIDPEDFGVSKIAGRPARNPSFWIKQTSFVRQYQKLQQLWLQQKDESISQARIFGTKMLTIEHVHYHVNVTEQETRTMPPMDAECQLSR